MAESNHTANEENTSKETDTALESGSGQEVMLAADQRCGSQFVGQWNSLVSTTNWEKGRIICDWREALMTDGSAVTEYSDEAWAQLVGGVTSQHVGRLRRVFQRFGEVIDQYQGLFWSHFQAALDWDDSEMWLEGALHNDWSVSQMRGKRWETLGTPPEQQQAETAEEANQLDEDFSADESQTQHASPEEASAASTQTIQSIDNDSEDDSEKSTDSDANSQAELSEAEPQVATQKRERLGVSVEELPDDLADAFEQFKLAIIAHRRENWRDTTAESVVECLDALRILALAEND